MTTEAGTEGTWSPLARAMTAISQRCTGDEWRSGIAVGLWVAAVSFASPVAYALALGFDFVTHDEIANLRALACASGCWCDWSDDEGRPVDVPLAAWLQKFWNVRGAQ